MRQQPRMAAPARAPMTRTPTELPTSGFVLVVDGLKWTPDIGPNVKV